MALVVLAALGTVVARADFHPACDPFSSASAGVDLAVTNYEFEFTGTVRCDNADEISITSLTLRPVGPLGSSGDAVPASCTSCSILSASGTASTFPGVYTVEMRFGAVGQGYTFQNVGRSARFVWTGVGQPTRIF